MGTGLISFILTVNDGRGRSHSGAMEVHEKTAFEAVRNYLETFPLFTELIFILVIIFMIYIVIKTLKHKKITKQHFIMFSVIFTTLIGILGFSAIRVAYASAILVFITCIIIYLPVLRGYSKNDILSTIIVISSILFLVFYNINSYDGSNYSSYYKDVAVDRADRTLVNIYKEADRMNKKEIVLTQDDIEKYNLETIDTIKSTNKYYNNTMSRWMEFYGYTKDFIPMRFISEEEEKQD